MRKGCRHVCRHPFFFALENFFEKNPPFSLTGGGHEGKLLPRRWTGRLPRTEGGAAPAGPRGTLKTGRCTAREARGRGREIRMACIHSFIHSLLRPSQIQDGKGPRGARRPGRVDSIESQIEPIFFKAKRRRAAGHMTRRGPDGEGAREGARPRAGSNGEFDPGSG